VFKELSDIYFGNEVLTGLGTWVITAMVMFARVVSFIHMAPIFSNKAVTSMVRVGLSLLLTLILFDVHPEIKPPDREVFIPFVLLINIAIGFMMGYLSRLLFAIVVAGGEMMDSSMGFSSAQIFDPASGAQTTIMGRFMSMLCIVIFFFVHGPENLIEGLYNSFTTFPLYEMNLDYNVDKIIALTADIIRMGFILVSPVVLTILLNDLILGLISRASPQINAFQISFTIKPSIGIIVFMLVLPLFMSALINLFSSPSRLF
jgi:flagellar biosynthetic protein FliR